MEVKMESILSLKAYDLELEKGDEDEEIVEPTFPLWSSRVKNILAYICGLANFPGIIVLCTSAGEFGSTIFVPHLLARIFVGTPIALVEILLSRYITGNVSRIAKISPLYRAVFFCLMINTALQIIWNNMFMVYTTKYLIATFGGTLPWATCDPKWADVRCYEVGYKNAALLRCLKKYPENYCRNLTWERSENQYWRRVVGDPFHSPGYSVLYLFIIMALVVLVTCKGIQSLEKMLFLFVFGTMVLGLIFVLGSFHTQEEVKVLMDIWFFDHSLLAKPRIWIVGFENCFLSIGLGELVLSFTSSHGKIFDDIFLDVLVSILTEVFFFVILAVPFSGIMWLTKIRDQEKVIYPLFKDHLDTFISISEAVTEYPNPELFWAIIFYAQMVWLSLANQSVLTMSLGDAFYGLFNLETAFIHYFYFSCLLGVGLFILSIPALFIKFYSMFPFSTAILMTIFLLSFTLISFYGIRNLKSDFHFMMGYPAPMFFVFFWVASVPILFIVVLLKIIFRTPKKPLTYIEFVYVGVPLAIYLGGAVFEVYRAYKRKNIRSAFVANPNWGPSDPRLKTSRIIVDSVSATKEFLYRQELYTKLFVKPFDFTEQNIVQVI